jgi:membrane-bound lytic murein transglycosylase B
VRRSGPSLVAAAVAMAMAAGCAAEGAQEAPTSEPAPTTATSPPTSTTTTDPAPVDVFALRPPEPPDRPEDLAEQIASAERTIRDATSPEPAVAAAALRQQVAYRQLGVHPEWDGTVLAALPADLRPAVQRHAAARRELRAMHTKLSSTLPAWRIVPPEPAEELLAHYRAAEAEFGIPWTYLAAIHLVETAAGRIRGTSVAGAQGPMQFLPATWDAYGAGGDINDTGDAIMGAARYLAASNGSTDIAGALYAYNHSDRYVRGVSLYAELIAEHPRAFLGFYYWGVWYLTDQGDVYLPVGYEETAPVPVP